MVKRSLRTAWLDADRILLLWLASIAGAFVFTVVRGGNAAFALGLLVAGTVFLVASVETRTRVLFLTGAPLVAVGLLLQL
jgi:hypothetical protein